MKRVVQGIILLCSIIVLSVVSQGGDPPHNDASGVGCSDCHGQTLLSGQSPFYTDNNSDAAYNAICMDRCHVSGLSPFDGINAPPVQTHEIGGTLIKCTDCHHNHDQDQLYSGKNEKSAFFIATGTLDTGAPTPLDYNSGTDTTTITYDTLAATDGTSKWDDLSLLAEKTDVGRGAMLVPNHTSRKRWPIYIIESINTGANTITVKGNVSLASNLGIFYGQVIRRSVNYTPVTGMPKAVKFYIPEGANSFAIDESGTGTDNSVNGICQVCHTQTEYWRNDGTGADHNSGFNCIACHSHAEKFAGSGHDDTQFRWAGGCEDCHGAGDAAEAVVAGIHSNNCDLCHTTDGPYNADTEKLGPNGTGDARQADGDAGTWASTCTTCHIRPQVPNFHGSTIAEAAPVHDNLGGSIGQAAVYTGKLAGAYGGLKVSSYNCADCHATDRTSFLDAEEVLEIHIFESGIGSGTCLTCHGFAAVTTEINDGIGGTIVECEACHSTANGNGPSGEKMYQYDGVRHHKTVHAQTGNCTRCHADPRSSDLSAEPGYAGTAALKDGFDGDGINWNDGFSADYPTITGLGAGRPTQMACRLCHSNYETYTVDVQAEIDTDWDTSELPDKHGYNKYPPAHGLTIYADDFDATGPTLSYFDRDNDLGNISDAFMIRGAKQVTQTSIASHRIDAVDGSSQIKVLNYGTCFSCHTVQIRHASPIPAQDYDIPLQGSSDAPAPNFASTLPYDTLRYAPGRSVFNDFRGNDVDAAPNGSGSSADAWNDHGKPWGWNSFDDWNNRGQRVMWNKSSADYNWGSIASSRITVPVDLNVNKLEGYPGTATFDIRQFDTGPSPPAPGDIDDITITVAQWTGSVVYVEATSSIGNDQDFSFTYTGAGGPCNATMTWDTDHYEGTCVAASGYTGSDTVTVYNDTTPVPDKVTRPLTDLTDNPVTPVLSGISLADNNDSNPAPAEAGYTNSHSVAVTMSVSNYPTHVMFSEEADFDPNSGWLLFDETVNFTLEDLGPTTEGTRTLHARVKNGAGESGDQFNTIILDLTPPTVPSDTLTTPNGGETWPQATDQFITWSATADDNPKVNPIYLYYSTDSGSTYPNTIKAGEADDGSYTWTVDTIRTSNARVKLTARDKAGNEASDTSDANFTLWPFMVLNTNDSGAGSLRQAMTDIVDAGGNHDIWFNISAPITNDVAEINVASGLPTITVDGVVIDGGSQSALQGVDNPNGPEVRVKGPGGVSGFVFSGDNGELLDLQIGGFSNAAQSSGDSFVVLGNQFGFGSDSTGYDTDPALRNTNAIVLTGSSTFAYIGAGGSNRNYISCSTDSGLVDSGTDNEIYDNVFGILPDDSTECANASNAIDLSGASFSTVDGNTMCGSNYGIRLCNTTDLTARGNQFGVRYNGTNWIDCTDQIYAINVGGPPAGCNNNLNNVFGGSSVATLDSNLQHSNVIDPGTAGIKIGSTGSGIPTKIYGNFIGTNPEMDEVFTGNYGIYSSGSSSNGPAYIGGYDTGEAGNVIANTSQHGIYLNKGASSSLRFFGINRNTFYNNGNSNSVDDDAIYLPPYINPPNPDTWANNNIVRPTIDSATTSQVTVSGVVSGNLVEVYKSDYAGFGTENGEGMTFVGSATASGATVNVTVSGVTPGNWVTATKTVFSGASRETSEFSPNVQVP